MPDYVKTEYFLMGLIAGTLIHMFIERVIN